MMRYAGVRYLSSTNSSIYDYLSIEGVAIGDVVVVPTRFGLSIAQVVEMRDTSSVQALQKIKHVISDASEVLKNKRDEVQRVAIHKEIKARIEEKLENAQYEEYAKTDPVIRELTDKLKSME